MDFKAFRGSLNPARIFGVLQHNREFRFAHPEYFDPDGILVFCGAQGQGKTISAVSYCLALLRRYPAVVLCSNVIISDQSDLVFVRGLQEQSTEAGLVQRWLGERELGKRCVVYVPYDDVRRLTSETNGYGGVLYLIDEMHLEFNSLESKQLDSSIFYTVSQQRKQRKHIVGTSQVFQRLAKPFREQFKYVVQCRCLFRVLQLNRLVDALDCTEENGKLICNKIKSFFWFHSPALYESYDTLQVIRRTRNDWEKNR